MIFKITFVLSATAAIAFALRRSSAAVRHMVWTLGLSLALLVPLGAWIAPVVTLPAAVRFVTESAAATAVASADSFAWARWLWIAGAVLVALRFAAGHARAAMLVGHAEAAANRDGIPVRIAAAGTMPFTWGLLRSVVVLPSDGVSDPIWLHERAHAERRDHWWLLISQTACSAFWFHPLVWFAARQAEAERERACDDLAITGGSVPESYAEVLVEAARSGMALPSSAMAVAGQTPLEARVRAILDGSVNRRRVSWPLLAVAAGCAVALAIPLVAQEPRIHSVKEDGLTPPRIKSKVEPAYTQEARDAKISGKVVLNIEIHEDGRAHNVKIKEPLDAGLDVNAIRAVEAWTFEPGKKDGKVVRVAATVEVNFRLL